MEQRPGLPPALLTQPGLQTSPCHALSTFQALLLGDGDKAGPIHCPFRVSEGGSSVLRCLLGTEGGLSLPWRELLILFMTVFFRMLVQNNRMYIQTHSDTYTYPYPTHTPPHTQAHTEPLSKAWDAYQFKEFTQISVQSSNTH